MAIKVIAQRREVKLGKNDSVLRPNKNKRNSQIVEVQRLGYFLWLGYPDSNQERQDQNLQCYHYTIPQFQCALGTSTSRFAAAKVQLFLELAKKKEGFL